MVPTCVFFLIGLLKTISLAIIFVLFSIPYSYISVSDLHYHTLVLLCLVQSLLFWFLWYQLPVILIPLLAALLPLFFCALSCSLLTLQYLKGCWVHSIFCKSAILSHCCNSHKQSVCILRAVFLHHCNYTPTSSSRLWSFSHLPLPSILMLLALADNNKVLRWGKSVGDLHWFSNPADVTGVGIHLNKFCPWGFNFNAEFSLRIFSLVGWSWPADMTTKLLSHSLSWTEWREKKKKCVPR